MKGHEKHLYEVRKCSQCGYKEVWNPILQEWEPQAPKYDNFTPMSAIMCPTCRTVLFSRHRHDFRTCGCENEVFIDGGREYTRLGFKGIKPAILIIYAIDDEGKEISQEVLSKDYVNSTNKYGKLNESSS